MKKRRLIGRRPRPPLLAAKRPPLPFFHPFPPLLCAGSSVFTLSLTPRHAPRDRLPWTVGYHSGPSQAVYKGDTSPALPTSHCSTALAYLLLRPCSCTTRVTLAAARHWLYCLRELLLDFLRAHVSRLERTCNSPIAWLCEHIYTKAEPHASLLCGILSEKETLLRRA